MNSEHDLKRMALNTNCGRDRSLTPAFCFTDLTPILKNFKHGQSFVTVARVIGKTALS